jgi:hypothetical protein
LARKHGRKERSYGTRKGAKQLLEGLAPAGKLLSRLGRLGEGAIGVVGRGSELAGNGRRIPERLAPWLSESPYAAPTRAQLEREGVKFFKDVSELPPQLRGSGGASPFTNPWTGQIYIPEQWWNAAGAGLRARGYWEEAAHSWFILNTPERLRPLTAKLYQYSQWWKALEEGVAGGQAMGSATKGLIYGLTYNDTVGYVRLTLEAFTAGLIAHQLLKGGSSLLAPEE